MADAETRSNSVLGAEVARRLIARPIRRHVSLHARAQQPQSLLEAASPWREVPPITSRSAVPIEQPAPPAKKLEAEVRLMKAVIEAERRENASLRACVAEDDEELSDEARAVRDRWMRVVDRLLQASA